MNDITDLMSTFHYAQQQALNGLLVTFKIIMDDKKYVISSVYFYQDTKTEPMSIDYLLTDVNKKKAFLPLPSISEAFTNGYILLNEFIEKKLNRKLPFEKALLLFSRHSDPEPRVLIFHSRVKNPPMTKVSRIAYEEYFEKGYAVTP